MVQPPTRVCLSCSFSVYKTLERGSLFYICKAAVSLGKAIINAMTVISPPTPPDQTHTTWWEKKRRAERKIQRVVENWDHQTPKLVYDGLCTPATRFLEDINSVKGELANSTRLFCGAEVPSQNEAVAGLREVALSSNQMSPARTHDCKFHVQIASIMDSGYEMNLISTNIVSCFFSFISLLCSRWLSCFPDQKSTGSRGSAWRLRRPREDMKPSGPVLPGFARPPFGD